MTIMVELMAVVNGCCWTLVGWCLSRSSCDGGNTTTACCDRMVVVSCGAEGAGNGDGVEAV